MDATRDTVPTRKLGSFVGQLAHGGLLMTGLIAACYLGIGYLQQPETVEHGSLFGESLASLSSEQSHESVPASLASGGRANVAAAVVPAAYQASDEHRLSTGMLRVRDYLARRFHVSGVALEPLLRNSEEVGHKLGLDPLLLIAVIGVESRFNPFAESAAGAQGLMQIMPSLHVDKLGPDADDDALFNPMTNIRVGAMVLKENLRRTGEMTTALQYYSGSPTDPDASYATKVLNLKERLEMAARRGV